MSSVKNTSVSTLFLSTMIVGVVISTIIKNKNNNKKGAIYLF
jgi:hypothetical protein